jgi:hypothetical protein
MEPEDLLKGLRPAATSNVTTFDQIPYRHRAFLSGIAAEHVWFEFETLL